MNELYTTALLKNEIPIIALGTVEENDEVKSILNTASEIHIPTPESPGCEGAGKSEREKWRSDFGL